MSCPRGARAAGARPRAPRAHRRGRMRPARARRRSAPRRRQRATPRDRAISARTKALEEKSASAGPRQRLQRPPESLGGAGGISGREPGSALRQELLEAVRIASARLEPEPVAPCSGDHDVASQRLAQSGDNDLNCVVRVRRQLVAPQLLDHAIGGNDLLAVDEQQGQERPRPSTRHLERATFMVEHLDGPEDQELQVPPPRQRHASDVTAERPILPGSARKGKRWSADAQQSLQLRPESSKLRRELGRLDTVCLPDRRPSSSSTRWVRLRTGAHRH